MSKYSIEDKFKRWIGPLRQLISRGMFWLNIVSKIAIFAVTVKVFDIDMGYLVYGCVGFVVFMFLMRFELKEVLPLEYDWVYRRVPFFRDLSNRCKRTEAKVNKIESLLNEKRIDVY